MATNFTTLALVLLAAKEIASADLEVVGKAVLAVVLVGLASAPAWVPVALTRVAPGAGQRILEGIGRQIARLWLGDRRFAAPSRRIRRASNLGVRARADYRA
jgi:hypothetical protein